MCLSCVVRSLVWDGALVQKMLPSLLFCVFGRQFLCLLRDLLESLCRGCCQCSIDEEASKFFNKGGVVVSLVCVWGVRSISWLLGMLF